MCCFHSLSPLDWIIDALGGPSCVAEMTGSRGRIGRKSNGKLQYETRARGRSQWTVHAVWFTACPQELHGVFVCMNQPCLDVQLVHGTFASRVDMHVVHL